MTAKPSWRDFWKVHPACDVFPLMDADALRKLADDIEANGLKVPIERRLTENGVYVIDGRNRLDALEISGVQLVDDKGGWLHPEYVYSPGKEYTDAEIAADVIGFNAHRRHQTKQDLADCIVKALAAGSHDVVKITKSCRKVGSEPGKFAAGGSEKGFRGKAVEIAKQHGISASTVDKALAKQKPDASTPSKRKSTRKATPKEPIESEPAYNGPVSQHQVSYDGTTKSVEWWAAECNLAQAHLRIARGGLQLAKERIGLTAKAKQRKQERQRLRDLTT